MDGDWHLHVHREYIGGNPRFDFPTRPLGWGKLAGVFPLGFGLLFVWMPGKMAWHSIQKLFEGDSNVGNVIFGIFPLVFVVAGCLPLGIGLLILFGRCRVEWRDGRLWAAEILGPFRWTRRMPQARVSRLEIAAASSKSANSPPRQFDNCSGLAAIFEDGKKKILVLGYPKAWLLAIAGELKNYVGGSAFSAATQVEVVESLIEDQKHDDVLRQPADSRVQVEERGEDVRLFVPPAGIWRGAKGYFIFGLLWCSFMVFVTVTMFSSGFKGSITATIFFEAGFWLVGIGVILLAIHMGKREATLSTEGGRLRIETKGLFGTKQWEWSRAEIAAIRADASGMEVNERPVIELQIHPRTGKKVGVLSGNKEEELRWMATRLRRALDLPAH
jgi:hypothetical protein